MAKLARQGYDGPSVNALLDRRRRLSRAFADGAYLETEYEYRLGEIDRQLGHAQAVTPPNVDEAVALFSNIPLLWSEATLDERRKLIGPLIQRVYVDLEHKQIAAIVPEPPFLALLAHAIQKAPETPVLLVPMAEWNHEQIWSWWRRGRVDLYHEHGLGVLVVDRLSRLKYFQPAFRPVRVLSWASKLSVRQPEGFCH